ncbi:MAG: DUF92 domain-containing protein [Gemmatimonadota bacterium]|nr:DUF92 domain-containing protein [Gemmatimonadota bacterium]
MTPSLRAALGFVVATAVAGAARRARALSPSGAVAAVLVGTAAVAAGWDWGALLIAFFVASSLLSRVRRGEKAAAAGAIAAKGDERDAVQVLANGALFALAALGYACAPGAAWQAMGGGALAAATADTWSTEIGLLAPRPPRSIVTLRPVPPGTSGGVTALGLLGGVLGASFIQIVAVLCHWPLGAAVAVVVGGVAGTLADSLFGALAQQRRWCDGCGAATERAVHACGQPTRIVGGIPWLDNDGVNALATLAGALAAASLVGRL